MPPRFPAGGVFGIVVGFVVVLFAVVKMTGSSKPAESTEEDEGGVMTELTDQERARFSGSSITDAL